MITFVLGSPPLMLSPTGQGAVLKSQVSGHRKELNISDLIMLRKL